MPAGRPLKFKTVKDLEDKIEAYFESCRGIKENGEEYWKKPLTITGLAVALDTSRETLINYEEKEEYFDAIKKAKSFIENYVEEYLFNGKNTAGAIFNLINNYKGWKNKQETDITSGGEPIKGINYITPNGDNTSTND